VELISDVNGSMDGQSNTIELINKTIEESVVAKDLDRLQSLYADDFVFTHGTGLVQTRRQWLDTLLDTSMRFVSRDLESTTVEVHQDSAIVTGTLIVHRHSDVGDSRYGLQYVRLFSLRSGLWQLVSHRTISQWDL
jgi:ketosteroid isomerase-like protein